MNVKSLKAEVRKAIADAVENGCTETGTVEKVEDGIVTVNFHPRTDRYLGQPRALQAGKIAFGKTVEVLFTSKAIGDNAIGIRWIPKRVKDPDKLGDFVPITECEPNTTGDEPIEHDEHFPPDENLVRPETS